VVSARAAGYSGTSLERKLGVEAGRRVAVLGAPAGFTLAGVTPRTRLGPELDVILAFFTDRRALERRLPALRAAMHPAGGLWIAWPKRASGVATDLTEDVVRELGLAARLVDNKVCAVDATWSALRLVIRRRDRGATASGSP
jgi:hypothetical protein